MKRFFPYIVLFFLAFGIAGYTMAAPVKQNLGPRTPQQLQNTYQNLLWHWARYTSPHNNDFVEVVYPSNFFVQDYSENGYPILKVQSAPGMMTLPGEGDCSGIDECNMVSGGLRIMTKVVSFETHTNLEANSQLNGFFNENLEPTSYHNVLKVKDISKITPLFGDAALKEVYFYTGGINSVYQIDLSESNFNGNTNEILSHYLNSLENNKEFGKIKGLTEMQGQTALNVDTAQFFPYWEAPKAAEEDGNCIDFVDGNCRVAPPGIYIRDNSHELTPFVVSPDVKVFVTTYDPLNAGAVQEISFSAFKNIFTGSDPAHSYLQNTYYFFELRNGKIVKILELFMP